MGAEDQRMIYAGVSLADDACIVDLAQEDATVHLCGSLLGGGKKRKKKQYTKPKKIKHKHKKVKLAVLKYYRVDPRTQKIQRLKRECTSPECGPGVFMASHYDRQYCGKCHLTYMFKSDDAAKK